MFHLLQLSGVKSLKNQLEAKVRLYLIIRKFCYIFILRHFGRKTSAYFQAVRESNKTLYNATIL